MIKKLLTAIFILSLNAYAYADCVGPTVNGKCLSGTSIRGYGDDSSNNSGYQSNSGARYQYDRNNPVDSNSYSIDLDAQRRDQMNTNPRKNSDRNSGQYGGGIYND